MPPQCKLLKTEQEINQTNPSKHSPLQPGYFNYKTYRPSSSSNLAYTLTTTTLTLEGKYEPFKEKAACHLHRETKIEQGREGGFDELEGMMHV